LQELLATIHHINEVTQHIENNLPARYLYSATNEAEPAKVKRTKEETDFY
jgi:hypothetical protein